MNPETWNGDIGAGFDEAIKLSVPNSPKIPLTLEVALLPLSAPEGSASSCSKNL